MLHSLKVFHVKSYLLCLSLSLSTLTPSFSMETWRNELKEFGEAFEKGPEEVEKYRADYTKKYHLEGLTLVDLFDQPGKVPSDPLEALLYEGDNHLKEADHLLYNGEHETAKREYTKAIDKYKELTCHVGGPEKPNKFSLEAMHHLGKYHAGLYEDQSQKDSEEAKKWFQMAADYGCTASLFELGYLNYREGDESLAIEYYKKTSQYHDMFSMAASFALGNIYQKAKNYGESLHYYTLAENEGHDGATEMIKEIRKLMS